MIVSRQKQNSLSDVIFLMFLCLGFVILGNFLFHSGVLPTNGGTTSLLRRYFVGKFTNENPFLLFVWRGSRNDLLCVGLIAGSGLIRSQKLFACSIFSYKSLLFGYSGACLVSHIANAQDFYRNTAIWLLFFVRYTLYFSLLICFLIATTSEIKRKKVERARYLLVVLCEFGLVLLINCVYYYLIDKI